MCIPEVRECLSCGWNRPWYWHKCRSYLSDEVAACRVGNAASYPPSKCRNSASGYNASNLTANRWPFKHPALQCGNLDCPERANADAVRLDIRNRLEEEQKDLEEKTRLIRARERTRQQRFAQKYFVRRPVLSIEEQQQLLLERELEEERAMREEKAVEAQLQLSQRMVEMTSKVMVTKAAC